MKNNLILAAAGAGLIAMLFTAGTAFADNGQHGGDDQDGHTGIGIGATVGLHLGEDMHDKGRDHASTTPAVLPQGNGQPVVGGSVTAVSGSTVTITNKSNVTYTVNAASSTVAGKVTTAGAIAVGDNVLVQGAVSGTSITASSIIDAGAPKAPHGTSTASTTPEHGDKGLHIGQIFGGLGNFFHHLFGFF